MLRVGTKWRHLACDAGYLVQIDQIQQCADFHRRNSSEGDVVAQRSPGCQNDPQTNMELRTITVAVAQGDGTELASMFLRPRELDFSASRAPSLGGLTKQKSP
jgi:hypothetical protein